MSSDGEVKVRMERQAWTQEDDAGFHPPEGNRRPREAVIREGAQAELDFRKLTLAATWEVGYKHPAQAQVGRYEARAGMAERRTPLIRNLKRQNQQDLMTG